MRVFFLALFSLGFVVVFAQVKHTAVSHPVDTRMFFPQVQKPLQSRPIRVSHKVDLPELPIRPNKLRAGGVLGESFVVPGAQFAGIGQSGLTPGDPDLAVGTGHIVEVINSQIAFFTKAGVKEFQQSAQTFFAGMGAFNFQFDPKISYDRVHDRFVLIFLERDTSAGNVSKVLVAVSDDGNPNGTWHRYRVEAKMTIAGVDYWMDYPGLGYNKDAYVVNGNMFRFGGSGFQGVQFLVIPSAPALTGAPVTVTSLHHSGGASAQAADTIDPNLPYVFAVSRSGGTSMRVYAVRDLTTTPNYVFTSVTVPANAGPAGDAESTNGTTLDTIDARVFNAVWRGGRLLTAHNYEGASFVGCRWYELDTGTWPVSGSVTLVQSGGVESPTFNYFFPAISKNKTGKISMLFTRSSTTVTADFMVASRTPGAAAGTMGAPLWMMSSVGDNYSQNRWGDYFCVDVDPVDDVTFWGVHMLVAANNSWWTEILSWTVPGTTFHPADAFMLFRGVLISGDLGSIASNDGNELVVKAGLVLSPAEHPVQIETEFTAPSPVVFDIDASVRARTNTPGLTQKIEVWNRSTNLWDVISQQFASTIESLQTGSTTGDPMQYLEPGTNRVKVKFSWFRTGLTLVFPWTVSVDQVQVSINGG